MTAYILSSHVSDIYSYICTTVNTSLLFLTFACYFYCHIGTLCVHFEHYLKRKVIYKFPVIYTYIYHSLKKDHFNDIIIIFYLFKALKALLS